MAVLCLADSLTDLKARLGRMVVAYSRSGADVYKRQAIRADYTAEVEGNV